MDIDKIYEQHECSLRCFCLKLSKNHQVAEDLQQEVMLKAIGNVALLGVLKKYQQKAWLFNVAKNQYTDWLRKLKNEELVDEDYLDEPVEMDDGEIAFGLLINQFPQKYQNLIVMKYKLGMNSKEIAAQLGIPDSTVRRRLQIALKKVKNNFI